MAPKPPVQAPKSHAKAPKPPVRARRPPAQAAPPAKPGLHPRNRHGGGYDFPKLIAVCPELEPYVRRAPHGGPTIDFADPAAVKALNRALLLEAYGIRGWDLPADALCPPIPGRADYLHHLADLLAEGGPTPRGAAVRALDIGTGASVIYPLLGHQEYGWSFVASDLDGAALASAARILAANPGLEAAIALRRQPDPKAIFRNVVGPDERFDLTLCNPPFHASAREAREAAQTKWRKLGRGAAGTTRNFGGRGAELWCEGGEAGFVRRMIDESVTLAIRVGWFTTLVSSSANLPGLHRALRQAGAVEVRTVPMAQGQKQSRFLAWTFLEPEARAAWSKRWTNS
ncbi:23S rRNA (adenine(1618)-N(6))-methyltransferase RlmF [Geothrix fuzhouensis]|uniref:23S rRNA (adenine(1618)-N(6))-methyltransferase RlmF n=1 Tax=Geothrix fuzhouensis TaxID=2966451 RepID=UPI002148427F|nr:23S rRNA (adenine(1618)-N(6))-methyltransferase RlmF [Geothrix fuzhouensis]